MCCYKDVAPGGGGVSRARCYANPSRRNPMKAERTRMGLKWESRLAAYPCEVCDSSSFLRNQEQVTHDQGAIKVGVGRGRIQVFSNPNTQILAGWMLHAQLSVNVTGRREVSLHTTWRHEFDHIFRVGCLDVKATIRVGKILHFWPIIYHHRCALDWPSGLRITYPPSNIWCNLDFSAPGLGKYTPRAKEAENSRNAKNNNRTHGTPNR